MAVSTFQELDRWHMACLQAIAEGRDWREVGLCFPQSRASEVAQELAGNPPSALWWRGIELIRRAGCAAASLLFRGLSSAHNSAVRILSQVHNRFYILRFTSDLRGFVTSRGLDRN